MTASLSPWVRGQPLLAFYVLAFAITWLGWVPQALHSRGLFPFDSPLFYVLGGIGPMAAAFIVLRLLHGQEAYKELFEPLLRWRVGVGWYIMALFGYPAIWLASIGVGGEIGPELGKAGPLLALLPIFLISFVAAIPEEVAWRGFALPRLQSRHSALLSSLIIGVLAALWHLPLLLAEGAVMSTYPLVPYFVYVVGLSVLYAWFFNSTGGSVLIVTIFHATSNTVGSFDLAEATVTLVLAAIVVVAFGPAHLSRRGGRIVRNVGS